MATLISVLIHLLPLPEMMTLALVQILFINLSLAIFNLIPIYPLDGSKIILVILPKEMAFEYEQMMHQYGMFILLVMILPLWNGVSVVSTLVSPVLNLLYGLFLF